MSENLDVKRIVVVDDHPMVIEGLRSLIESQDHLDLAGTFTNGKEVLHFIRDHNVDLILLDIHLPDISGIDLCKQLRKTSPNAVILAFSNHTERAMIMHMLHNGATGYLLKTASAEELLEGIQKALASKLVFSNDVEAILVKQNQKDLAAMPSLTRREKEIIENIADGYTTQEIADRLFISPLTVETHRRNVMQKFNANNSPSLIRIALEHRLI